jgi:hypothetical protein
MPRSLFAGQQAAGVGFERLHGQAVGRQLRSGPADARGPFGFDQRRGLLAGRQATDVGFVQRHSQAVGRRLGSGLCRRSRAIRIQSMPWPSHRTAKLLASASYDGTVRLWDVGSGAALQTLEVDVALRTLSFSDDGTSLRTDRGLLLTINLLPGAGTSLQNLSRGLFVKEQWVTRETGNILWILPVYRPTCTAVHGKVVVLRTASGRMLSSGPR